MLRLLFYSVWFFIYELFYFFMRPFVDNVCG